MPRDLVERERLTSALEKGAHLPLTLVSAPAGYGKFLDLGPEIGKLLNRLELDEARLPYVGQILAAYSDSAEPSRSSARSAHPQPLIDPLSKRELDVLSLLAEHLSNREIGGQLYISPSTVKRHAENIFDKLGVRGRREAVAQAAGLGILGA